LNKGPRNLFLIVLAVFAIVALMNVYSPGVRLSSAGKPLSLSYSEFREQVEKKNIDIAAWQQTEIKGKLKNGKTFVAKVPDYNSPQAAQLTRILDDNRVNWKLEDPPISDSVLGFLSMFAFPILLFLAIYFFLIRPAQMGGNQALSFGRNRARKVSEDAQKITFDDVAGIDEAKQELFEIVDFLKNTQKYIDLGAKIPKGILLTGPPGVGKTYLARAIAGEAGVPFYFISGSDFVEMFVGVGAARVRDLFETAKANRPCVIFIDEIDAVGRQRGAGLGGGHDEREQTLNQLLVEMDGFEPNLGVVLIAATNRPDVLDPAILRPGRFDRRIVIDGPDVLGREAILNVHIKGKPVESDVNLATVAKRTPGFTGADLANALNEAALLAARKNQKTIRMANIEDALDRVIAGPQRNSKVMSSEEREVIAVHEAGHAVVGELLEHSNPVHKVTILPRGMSLGSTWSLPEHDKYLVSQQELLDEVSTLLAGRVAEEIVYGKVWTGASNDLERVTKIARAMVCEYGMSQKLGTRAIGRRARNPFLGRDYATDERDYSEDVARSIDDEVHGIVAKCHQKAHDIIASHRPELDKLVQLLLDKETIERPEFLEIMGKNQEPSSELISNKSVASENSSASVSEEPKKERKPSRRVAKPEFKPNTA
jgi:cell division protease FtsH